MIRRKVTLLRKRVTVRCFYNVVINFWLFCSTACWQKLTAGEMFTEHPSGQSGLVSLRDTWHRLLPDTSNTRRWAEQAGSTVLPTGPLLTARPAQRRFVRSWFSSRPVSSLRRVALSAPAARGTDLPPRAGGVRVVWLTAYWPPKMSGFWNFSVRVSPQILTKDPRQFAFARKVGHYA